jgi:6-phosphogluconolactonase
MKFRKFGKALLMSALSAGALLSVTSCVQSYSVGFLYVIGTQTSSSAGQGIISGFKIDHNTGRLVSIAGLPMGTGGSYPERAVLISGSRFLYVLNKGTDACVTDQPCTPTANITEFAVGGNGVLAQQGPAYYTQGFNPFRMFVDSLGSHLFVLDHDAPTSASCSLALGSGVSACGDITAFNIDTTTGRLSLIQNAQVSSASGAPLPFFPVPAEPIDFLLNGGYVLTLSGTTATGDSVFPYSYSQANGQLSVGQNTSQPLNIHNGTALQSGSTTVYVLDDEPLTIPSGSSSLFPAGTYPSQILPFSVGTGGSLQAQTGGAVPTDATQSDPLFLLVENKSKWAYVANYGNNSNPNSAQSGITGYDINTQTNQLIPMPGSPFGTGAGPRCLIEDPSNQFIYTANFNSSTVTGLTLDQNQGVLKPLPGTANKAYALPGPATYCLVDGRTS